MANKPFNSRIQLKHDTEAHWLLATGFSPLAGELIVYDVDANYTYPRFKVGDGSTNVNSLPFITAEAAQRAIDNTIAAGSTSTNLPTSAAVADFVENKGYTTNTGTITGITMNGASKGTSGVVNLGTVLTAHQDITSKADKSATVSNVAYNTTNKKITKTINGTTSDVVSVTTLKTDMAISKSDIGLSNVENKSSATIRSEITSANVTTALGFTPLNASLKGANSGVAELDSNGKVPSSQLPSYVDDVLEYSALASFPATGEVGKIYVDTTTNKTYRWSGSNYVEISASLALGTTSSTAYRGDYGAAAYAHAVTNKGSAFSSGLYKITTNSEGHVTAATAVTKADITALNIPAQDTTYTFDGTYNASSNKAATVSTVTNAVSGLAKGPLIITTSNTSASDALTHGTAVTLTNGQLVFVFLNKAMTGSANATLKLGSNAAINIYLTASTQLNAAFAEGSVLGMVYYNSKLYMINPPVAI